MNWQELWQQLLQTPVGQEVAYAPEALKGELEEVDPIFEISEQIRPRLVLVAISPGGSNFLCGVSYHTTRQAYQARGRLRYPDGAKEILPPSVWRSFSDDAAYELWTKGLAVSFAALAAEHRWESNAFEFPKEATDDEIIERFTASGVFDVMKLDPATGNAKRMA